MLTTRPWVEESETLYFRNPDLERPEIFDTFVASFAFLSRDSRRCPFVVSDLERFKIFDHDRDFMLLWPSVNHHVAMVRKRVGDVVVLI